MVDLRIVVYLDLLIQEGQITIVGVGRYYKMIHPISPPYPTIIYFNLGQNTLHQKECLHQNQIKCVLQFKSN